MAVGYEAETAADPGLAAGGGPGPGPGGPDGLTPGPGPPDVDPLELAEVAEVMKCEVDSSYFCDRYLVIDAAQGREGDTGAPTGTMPFRLWPAQVGVMWSLMTERLVIILKARQLGISWVVCAHVLWSCLFRPGQLWLMFSKGQKEANELIRRVRVLYERLPDWMKNRLPGQVGSGSKTSLQWANGSRVLSMPATRNSGVSYTASGVVMDEAAKMLWAAQLYTAVKPTIDAGGQMILLSTAEGTGNFYYQVWVRAERALNAFKAIFLPWWARPDRDRAWYARIVAEAAQPKLVPQEYPATAHEAFVTSGNTVFETDSVLEQERNLEAPVPRYAWPPLLTEPAGYPWEDDLPPLQAIPGLSVYRPPVPGRRYVLAADTAEGKDPTENDDPDFDAAVMLDAETWEEMATLHGRWRVDEFAGFLMVLAAPYGAEVAVERNNHGHAVLATLRLKGFPFIGLGPDGDQGWLTNVRTKPMMVDFLAEALAKKCVTVRHRATLTEMQNYARHKSGATGAQYGQHDDLVMAWAVALSYIRHRRQAPGSEAPRAVGERFKVTGFLRPR